MDHNTEMSHYAKTWEKYNKTNKMSFSLPQKCYLCVFHVFAFTIQCCSTAVYNSQRCNTVTFKKHMFSNLTQRLSTLMEDFITTKWPHPTEWGTNL